MLDILHQFCRYLLQTIFFCVLTWGNKVVIVLFVLLYNISLVSIKKKHDLKSICCFYFHDFIVIHLLCEHFQMKLNTIWTDIHILD